MTMIRGDWRIVERDAHTLKAIAERRMCNVLTSLAHIQFAKGLYDPRDLTQKFQPTGDRRGYPYDDCLAHMWTIYRPYWYIVLGTGEGVPAVGDTDLFTATAATARHATKSRTDNVVKYTERYLPEAVNGPTYTEAGIFEWVPYYEYTTWHDPEEEDYLLYHVDPRTYTYGKLMSHALIDPPIEKTDIKLLDFEVTVTYQ